MIALRADRVERGGEFIAGEVARFRLGGEPKLLNEFRWDGGQGRDRKLDRGTGAGCRRKGEG